MINRLKKYLDLTKKISSTGIMYVDDGKVYTYGKTQMFQAVTDITEDKNSIKFELNKKTFKLPIAEFTDFEKNYKKSVEDVTIDQSNNLIITTNIPNVKLESLWTEDDTKELKTIKKFFDKLNTEDCSIENRIAECILAQDQIEYFLAEKPIKIYINKKLNTIQFETPKEKPLDFTMIAVLDSYLGKFLKSSKDVILSVYKTTVDKNIFILKLSVTNEKFVTTYYGKFVNYKKKVELPE